MFDKENINVLNYHETEVFADTSKDNYKFGASRDGMIPSVNVMTLGELQNIHSNTQLISSGWLMFDEDVKEEIYTSLRIHNWKDILTNTDIRNSILHPTIEGLQKFIDIKHIAYFDRVRAILFKLEFDGYEITTKVRNLIEARYLELQNRQRNSLISLKERELLPTTEDIKSVKEENGKLKEEMAAMQKQMAEMMTLMQANMQSSATATQSVEEIEEIETEDEITGSADEKSEHDEKVTHTSKKRKTKKK